MPIITKYAIPKDLKTGHLDDTLKYASEVVRDVHRELRHFDRTYAGTIFTTLQHVEKGSYECGSRNVNLIEAALVLKLNKNYQESITELLKE